MDIIRRFRCQENNLPFLSHQLLDTFFIPSRPILIPTLLPPRYAVVVSSFKVAEPISIPSPAREKDPHLQLYVVFTDLEATRAALKTACLLARELNARLVLLVAKVVPYPLPLEAPPVSGAFTARLLSQLAAEQETDVTVRVYLCRDRALTIRDALGPGSLVVIGHRKRWWPNGWWPNGAPALARLLKREGHQVILAGISRIQPARIASVNVESSL
jgi:hypothetical protein